MPKVMTTAKGSMEPYLVTEQPGQILEERGGGQGWQEEVHSPRHRQLLLALPQGGRRHLLRGLSQTQGERWDTVGFSLTLFCADLHAKGDDGREGPDGALPGDGADRPDTGGAGGRAGVSRGGTLPATPTFTTVSAPQRKTSSAVRLVQGEQ